ncbi:MAG: response regulator [Magnetococcales bacterium]|nr:response regulator [Magnetococcales bacterium]
MSETGAESQKKLMVFKKKELPQAAETRPLAVAWKVLVVDDDEQIHILTREVLQDFVFEGRPLLLISAYSGQEAQQLLKQHLDAAVVLLDVVMETRHAGLEVVKFIRTELGSRQVRILLRTGQAGEFPEEKIFEEYDINSFLEKTDLTSRRLKSVLKTALRAHRDICEIDQARIREVELRRAADAANVAKSNFLHMMSHELRTPLQGTKGPLEEFKTQFALFSGIRKLHTLIHSLADDALRAQFSSALTEVQTEVVEIAGQGLQSVEHLLGLVEDILDFARIEAGKLQLFPSAQAVQPVIHAVIDTVRPLAEQKGLRLEVRSTAGLTVMADEKRLKQILFNLLGNAIKFTSQGSISLTAFPEGNQALFCVEDTGCGIPDEKQEMIFGLFEQADNSATRSAGGTGLGLPITRELVRKQGGEIRLQSVFGKGSVFSFTLPLATPGLQQS